MFVDIIYWHARGTRYGIKVDPDGLLASGELGVQLTWMDAKVGDWVVTPRRGKPVEIQALWYNALCIMEDLASRFGDEAARKGYRHMAAVAQWSFNRLFWNEKLGCLYDVVNGGPPDPSIRPNQIFAVSLFHSVLPLDRAGSVVEKVKEHLLTPFGLRTSHRATRYIVDSIQAVQGARWSLPPGNGLAVAAGTVHYRVYEGEWTKRGGRRQAQAWLSPLESHLAEAGLGHVSEIFEGDAPHRS